MNEGKRKIKARLVARGYEENTSMRTDSPTCTKECFRLMLILVSSYRWKCNTIDIKSAFLQGKPIEREVFIRPPRECRKEGILWKLKTTVYGLNDASRTWYLRVREELGKLLVKVSKYDAAFFYWHYNDNLQGIMSTHVDDFCWAGSNDFINLVIEPLRNIFDFGKEHNKAFKYLGLNMNQENGVLKVDKIDYLDMIKPIEVNGGRSRKKDSLLNDKEKGKLRKLIGQLNWLATQTRPDLSFACCALMSAVKNATIGDILHANKILVKAKSEKVVLQYPNIKDLKEAKIIVYHDASFANLYDGGSQGGNIIFLADVNDNNMTPISWSSRRLKRVVKSTLAAETLAQVAAVETAYWIATIIQEVLWDSKHKLPYIECRTDSRSLFENAQSLKPVLDKRLRVDIAIVHQMLEKGELQKILWVEKEKQLADPLTKRGVSSNQLLQVIADGKLQ